MVSAFITDSHGVTPRKHTVHTARFDSRVSNDTGYTLRSLLKQCIARSSALAEAAGAESIAIAPISTNIYMVFIAEKEAD